MEEKQLVQHLSSPLYDAKGWIKLVGILSIISGVGLIFTLIGILVCWLPIWMGILLLSVASNAEKARQSGETASLSESLNKLKTYFTVNGVMALIAILFFVISMIISGGALLTGLRSLQY